MNEQKDTRLQLKFDTFIIILIILQNNSQFWVSTCTRKYHFYKTRQAWISPRASEFFFETVPSYRPARKSLNAQEHDQCRWFGFWGLGLGITSKCTTPLSWNKKQKYNNKKINKPQDPRPHHHNRSRHHWRNFQSLVF